MSLSTSVFDVLLFPIMEIGGLLSPLLSFGTSLILFIWLLLMFGLEVLVYYDKSTCNHDQVCVKVIKSIDDFAFKIFQVVALMFWAYIIYVGVKMHGMFSFQSYSRSIGAALFFQMLYLILVDLTGLLSLTSYSDHETELYMITKKFFGRLLGELNLTTSTSDNILYISLIIGVVAGSIGKSR